MKTAEAVRRIEKIQTLAEDLLENFPEKGNDEIMSSNYDDLKKVIDDLGRVADILAAEGD